MLNGGSGARARVRGSRKDICTLILLAASFGGVAHGEAQQESSDAPIKIASATSDATALQTVVVTATRRSENVQEVPIPIAVVSGDEFASANQFRFEELNQRLPSTNVQFSNPRQTSIAVRGLGNNPANDALESSVGVYLDNVYLGRPGMANLDLIDIDQIALLRGPQGTLFGKNTTAGVLNITTRAPTFDPEAEADLSGGNYKYYQARGALSGPLTDAIAARLSVVKTYRDGFVDNITDGRRLNGSDRIGFRGQLLVKPSEQFDLRLIGDYNEEHSDCCISVLYSLGPNGGTRYLNFISNMGAQVVLDPDYATSTINDRQHMDVRQGGGSAEANLKLGDYKLTSITAYRAWWFRPANDGDYTARSALVNAGQLVDDEQWSQELRFASPDDAKLEWLTGLYYFYQYQSNRLYTQYGPDAGKYTGAAIFNDVLSLMPQYLHTNSVSAFAQGTWHATDRLSLTAGVRDTYEDKSTRVRRLAPVGGVPAAINAPPLTPYDSDQLERHDNNVSALLSVSYKLTEHVLAFASVSRGAKSGGINPSVPASGLGTTSLYIEPEIATDAELGVKSSLLEHRLIVNANLFWTRVKDYQATQLLESAPGVFTQFLSNIGRVRTQGAELEVSALLLQRLTLTLAASYNDAIYTDYHDAPCSAERLFAGLKTCDLTNSKVVSAPKWIVSPAVNYNRPLTPDINLTAGLEYSWRSWFYGSADNSQLAIVKSTGLLNAQLGLDREVGGHLWGVTLWTKNALDKRYVLGGLSTANQNGFYAQTPGLPRTYGATVSYKF
jgi:iron complex outermembrane receptor protein